MNNRIKITAHLLFTILLFIPLSLPGQGIRVKAANETLSSVLTALRNQYSIQISFNDRQLSGYNISADTLFSTPDELFEWLLDPLPLGYTKSGEVIVIFPVQKQKKINSYLVSGKVYDRYTGESLPFSHVSIEGIWTVTDFLGQFSYQTQNEPPYTMVSSYLGYFVLDTTVYSGTALMLGMIPSSIIIDEITVRGMVIEKSLQSGRNSGEIRINHQIASFLPGNGDNSVFNLLRLQPGITAAGELSNDLIIWGSYEGQSRVLFDGFTIFGLKNYNENISAVNPFMAKDIRVLKGGYGASYGERVGGIVDITGVQGARTSPDVNISVNNLTLNGYLSVPVAARNSFIMAFRQTYYDLYESTSLSLLSGKTGSRPAAGRAADINVIPDYLFRDVNLKVTGESLKGSNWYLSLFTGSDRFSYIAEEETFLNKIFVSSEERSLQQGASAFFGKRWGGGATTRATVSYSGYNNSRGDEREVSRIVSGNIQYSFDKATASAVDEYDFRIENSIPLPGVNSLEFGAGGIYDRVGFREDTSGVELTNNINSGSILNGYFTDIITPGKGIVIKPGFRVDYPVSLGEIYFQPRLSLSISAGDHVKFNGAAGRYNQFMALSSVIDETGNLRYIWTLCDNGEVPVISSNHFVSGITFRYNDLQMSLEGYYKTTDGLTRYINTRINRFIFHGDSRSRGLDFFIKQDLGSSTFWASYSLSKTEEYFTYFDTEEYRNALHDQRHEVKLAGILALNPFYLSGNWVWGSGFNYSSTDGEVSILSKPYNRADISAVFRFSRKGYIFDGGLSLLNIFDTENIKYSNLIVVPSSQTDQVDIHAEAVPRTLTIFINFSF